MARILFTRSAARTRLAVNYFGGALLVLVVACSGKEVTSDAVAATRTADGATQSRRLQDASSSADVGAGLPEDAGPSIDCVKAGSGGRPDSGLLRGLFAAHIDVAS